MDHDNRWRSAGDRPRPAQGRRTGSGVWKGLDGERHREGAAYSGGAVHPDLAAVGLGDLLHDGQPQAGAPLLAETHPVGTVEALKDPGEMLRLDARAGITHRQLGYLDVVPQGHGDPTSRWSVAEGILDQVPE